MHHLQIVILLSLVHAILLTNWFSPFINRLKNDLKNYFQSFLNCKSFRSHRHYFQFFLLIFTTRITIGKWNSIKKSNKTIFRALDKNNKNNNRFYIQWIIQSNHKQVFFFFFAQNKNKITPHHGSEGSMSTLHTGAMRSVYNRPQLVCWALPHPFVD